MAPPSVPQIWLRPLTSPGSIKFWWYPPVNDGGSSITGYVLSDGNGITINVGPGPEDPSQFRIYTVDSLTDGQDYTFSLTAQNADGDSPPATYRRVQPGGKATITQNATYTFINASNALVEWEAPADTGGSTIGWYVIQISDGTTTIKKSAHGYDRQLLVKDLDELNIYTVLVNAVNDAAYAPAATATNITPTNYGITIQSVDPNPVDIDTNVNYELFISGLNPNVSSYSYSLSIDSTVITSTGVKASPETSTVTVIFSFISPSTAGSYQITAELYDTTMNEYILIASATPVTLTVNALVPVLTISIGGNQRQDEDTFFSASSNIGYNTNEPDIWTVSGANISSASDTNGSTTFNFPYIGACTVQYDVTTVEYGPLTTSTTFSIFPSLTVDNSIPYIDTSVTFTANPQSLDTIESIKWFVDSSEQAGETGSTFTTSFGSTRSRDVTFSVTIGGIDYTAVLNITPTGPAISFLNVSPDPVDPNGTVTFDLDFTNLLAETEYHISGDVSTTFTTGVGETTKSLTGQTVSAPSVGPSSFSIIIELNNSNDVFIKDNAYLVNINPTPTLTIQWDQTNAILQGDTITFTISANGASYTYESDEWVENSTTVATNTNGEYNSSYSDIGRFTLTYSVTTTEFGLISTTATVYINPNITYDSLTPTVSVPTNFYVTQQYYVTPSQAYWVLDGISLPLETGSTFTTIFTDMSEHTVGYIVDSDYTYISSVTVNPTVAVIQFANISSTNVNIGDTVTFDINITNLLENTDYILSEDVIATFSTDPGQTTYSITNQSVIAPSGGTSFRPRVILTQSPDIFVRQTEIIIDIIHPTFAINTSGTLEQGETITLSVTPSGPSYTYSTDSWVIDNTIVATDINGADYSSMFSTMGVHVVQYYIVTNEFGPLGITEIIYINPKIIADTLTPTVGSPTEFSVDLIIQGSYSIQYSEWSVNGYIVQDGSSSYTTTFNDTNSRSITFRIGISNGNPTILLESSVIVIPV